MIPVLTAEQIRQADQYTIKHEPIKSIDLMERASLAFVKKFCDLVGRGNRIRVFCGVGNNGGDGLAISRILIGKGYTVHTYSIGNLEKCTPDFSINYDRLMLDHGIEHISNQSDFPLLSDQEIIVDAIFGSGLARPVVGLYGSLIKHLNDSGSKIISVDIASGLFADKPSAEGVIIQPWATISFQVPKLTFFQPSESAFVGRWFVEEIGLDKSFLKSQETNFYLTEKRNIQSLIRPRHPFMHKGEVGRLLIVAGSRGKMGAAVLSARAAMRSGVGLLTVHAPTCGVEILQTAIPEAMVSIDANEAFVTDIDLSSQPDVIGIGPGLGQDTLSLKAFDQFLKRIEHPIVVDADALNLLASNIDLLEKLPQQSILTPHPGEFKRLVGGWKNDFEKLDKLRAFASKYNLNVVLKGAYSAVCSAEGKVFFNPTGNPGMATAGSGDVLTGIVSALLTQDYDPFQALLIGVYVHGLAGDLAAKDKGETGLIASDIIDQLPYTFKSLSSDYLA